jgi:hypothetical protein
MTVNEWGHSVGKQFFYGLVALLSLLKLGICVMSVGLASLTMHQLYTVRTIRRYCRNGKQVLIMSLGYLLTFSFDLGYHQQHACNVTCGRT